MLDPFRPTNSGVVFSAAAFYIFVLVHNGVSAIPEGQWESRPGSEISTEHQLYKRDIQTGLGLCASGLIAFYISTITVFFISCTDRNHGSYKTGTESGSSYVKTVLILWNCISDPIT